MEFRFCLAAAMQLTMEGSEQSYRADGPALIGPRTARMRRASNEDGDKRNDRRRRTAWNASCNLVRHLSTIRARRAARVRPRGGRTLTTSPRP